MSADNKLIFAHLHNGRHVPDSIIENLELELGNLEYGDIAQGEYQIWEYPSGRIFDIMADRVVADRDYYATPNKDVWLPELVEAGTDKAVVEEAYARLEIRNKD